MEPVRYNFPCSTHRVPTSEAGISEAVVKIPRPP
jgi:hypothetical protein